MSHNPHRKKEKAKLFEAIVLCPRSEGLIDGIYNRGDSQVLDYLCK